MENILLFLEENTPLVKTQQSPKSIEYWNSCHALAKAGNKLSARQLEVLTSIYEGAKLKSAAISRKSRTPQTSASKAFNAFFENAFKDHVMTALDQLDNDY